MKSEKQDLERKIEKEPIALVGIGCRFPGNVKGPDEFWEGLKNGMDAISDIPGNRWKNDAFYDPNPNKAGKIKTKKGGFLNDIDKFDADFFGIYPKAAERIDPQQRMLLEVTYEAFEDAGLKLDELSGSKTAVYVGVFTNDYWDIQVASEQKDDLSPQVAMGVILTAIANRISYTFNLKGPSVTIDTACSSSLVGVHLACQSIWSGESKQAIAGGVNVMLRPETSIMMSKGNFLSPDGYCKSFDSRANGYVRSEGCGIVVLKPLSQAIEDGDNIYGTILGTAVNQDGFTETGFTVPSVDAQSDMLTTAYANAGIDPAKVSYIEAHGTGTPVGDPIETNAFGNVIGKDRKPGEECIIGSVKTNLGHLEAAAGVAGLIKLSLIVKNKQIPKNLHFLNPNPSIPFDDYKLKVATELQPLPDKGCPPICGVNSFGAGGTNAHVVMQAYDANDSKSKTITTVEDEQAKLFTLSARGSDALKALAKDYIQYVESNDASLEDICYSVINRRTDHEFKLGMAVKSKAQLIENLKAFVDGENRPGMHSNQVSKKVPRKIGFIFSGQGPQWYGMGQEMMKSSPIFKETIDQIDKYFQKIANWSLLEEMNKDENNSRVGETNIAQPAIMAIQIALTTVWKSRGIVPEGCVGHSIGEVAAAYASGALNLEQAVEVIFHRSRGQNKASNKGKMLAIGLPYQKAKVAINGFSDTVSVAAINGPNIVTLSGDTDPLEAIAKNLDKRDVFHKFLRVNVPFHSHHMAPLKEELIASLNHLEPSLAKIPLYSTVTGKQQDGKHLTSDYWYKNVREPVFFTDALQSMIEDGYNTFIEIAPHPVLTNGALDIFKENKLEDAIIVPSFRRKEDEEIICMGSLASLYAQGLAIDGEILFDKEASYVKLPGYAWQHKTFWFENELNESNRLKTDFHPHIKSWTTSANDKNHVIFDLSLDTSAHPYVEEHKVEGTIIFPGTGHLEIATAVGNKMYSDEGFFLEEVNFESALFIPEEGDSPQIRLEVVSSEGNYEIFSKTESGGWTMHSNGIINHSGDRFNSRKVILRDIQESVNEPLSVSDFYLDLKEKGLQYGESFRLLKHLWEGENALLGLLELNENQHYGVEKFNFHPTLLDACIHLIEQAGKWTNDDQNSGIYLPTHISRFKVHKKPSNTVWCYADVLTATEEKITADFWVMNDAGEILAEIQGFEFTYIAGSRGESKDELHEGMYEYMWESTTLDLDEKGKRTGNCLIFADNQQFGYQVAASCDFKHIDPIIIAKEDGSNGDLKHAFTVNPEDQSSIEQALNAIKSKADIDQILFLWSLDVKMSEHLSADELQQQQSTHAMSMLNAMRAIASMELKAKVTIVTQALEAVHAEDKINFNQSASLGISRVMMNEFPHIPVKIVDISQNVTENDVNLFIDIMYDSSLSDKPEVAIRQNQLYLRRLERVTSMKDNSDTFSYTAEANQYFDIKLDHDNQEQFLYLETKPMELGANDVEVIVNYTNVEPKNVIAFTKEGGSDTLEGYCAGVVHATGAQVTGFKKGDEVYSIKSQNLSGKIAIHEDYLIAKPQKLTLPEVVSSSTAYLTAYFALIHHANLKKGDFVLIHDAASAKGQAAISIAKANGAKILVSFNRAKEGDFLKTLGVDYVFDHNDLSFADKILDFTNGKGVDIIVNTLRKDALSQTLKCLRTYGAFIDMTEIGSSTQKLQINNFVKNAAYYSVDIKSLINERPELARAMLEEVYALLEFKKVDVLETTIQSISEFSPTVATENEMWSPHQLVMQLEGQNIAILPPAKLELDENATYLVTGGASGFGLSIGKWLVDRGAKHLALLSRSGCKSDEDRAIVANLENKGVNVNLVNVDITDSEAVKVVVGMITETMPPLKGIVHSAAVLEDATFANMDQNRFLKVFNPKVLGAWNLHQETKNEALEFFLMLSSISSMFGLPGQANYSSANNFLDKLAQYRQSKGLAGSSVNLGVLGNYAGMSKEGGNVMNVLANQGWLPLSFSQVTAKIEKILLQKPAQRMAANLDWKRFKDFFAHLNEDYRFKAFIDEAKLASDQGKQGNNSLVDEVLAAATDQQAVILQEKIADALARILGTSSDKINQNTPISGIGLDSLMLNQLRNWIHQKLEINYPLMRIAKGPSIKELAVQLLIEINAENASNDGGNSDVSGIESDPDIEILADKWLVRNKTNTQDIKYRIFCFHPVGAGASMFTHFLYNQPKNTDVLAVQLPGRENRKDETPYADMSALVKTLANVIKPYTDKPFIIMGHSFGGIVGFELIKYLRRAFNIQPIHFLITGTIAPQLTREWKKRDSIDQTSKMANSIEKILNTLNYIEDVEFLRSIIPVMKKDMGLIMNYPYETEAPFDFPITGFAADKDEVVLIPEVKRWEEQTNSDFNFEIVEGDHWFLGRNRALVLQRLTEALSHANKLMDKVSVNN